MNTNTNRTNPTPNAQRPVCHLKYGGVRISVWKFEHKEQTGRDFATWSVTIDRAYKDAKGAWQNTSSLRENDLPKAMLGLQKAYAYILTKGEAADDDTEVESVK